MNFSNRWVQLFAGIAGMVAVANFQYSWTLFEGPLHERHPAWTKVQIQDALVIFFVSAQTWLVPLEGYLAERFGPNLAKPVDDFRGQARDCLVFECQGNPASLFSRLPGDLTLLPPQITFILERRLDTGHIKPTDRGD